MSQSILEEISKIIDDMIADHVTSGELIAKTIFEALTDDYLEIILNERRFARKAQKMIEADSRD